MIFLKDSLLYQVCMAMTRGHLTGSSYKQLHHLALLLGYEGFNLPKLIPGANGDYMPPFLNHPQLLEHIEVQRRLAMITQQQQAAAVSAAGGALKHPIEPKTHTHHHITLKSSASNGASAFRPVQPKDKTKGER